MVNVVSGNPFILDTAGNGVVAAGVTLRPKKIKWIGDAIADGDICDITDGLGSSSIYKHIATADDTGETFEFPREFRVAGLSVGTLTHGTVYIWF